MEAGVAILDKDTDKMLTHMSDALGYEVEAEMKLRASSGFQRSADLGVTP